MKGLLLKDFALLKENRQIFMIVIIIAASATFLKEDGNFMLTSFVTILLGMMTITTISYDDFDNGNAFLLTLPISRKIYVIEKYVLGMLLTFLGWFISIAFMVLLDSSSLTVETIKTLCVFPFISFIMMAIMIPIQIKFGNEKGRIILLAIFPFCIILGFGLKMLNDVMHFDLSFFANLVSTLGENMLIAIVALICMLLFAVSCGIAIKIMTHKQF